MNNFITNSDTRTLNKRLIELIKKSKELKFLVGFFYFSGIRELYKGLKENPDVIIKVLVGLNVDKTNFGILELADPDSNISDEEKTHRFLQSVKQSLNKDDFDTKEFYEQVRYFVQLLHEDKLIIRKTFNPNHSKLYIFRLEEEQVARNKLFITGSSNLTKVGLTTQEEFNVEISDYGFQNAEDYFDKLWESATKITEDDTTKQKLIDIVEKDTLIKNITPFEAFVLVLKNYLDLVEPKEIGHVLIKTLKENGYKIYQYQLDAIRQALAVIEKNNGVLLADVVGLGKTIIACCIAKQLRKRGIVICPPAIIGDKNKETGWLRYTEEFGLSDWEVRSLGDLENISVFVKKTKDIEIVIVDEAHRFRNQDTKDYEYLKNICRNKIVILLTATPFNNRPGDILSLLKLFITPKKSSITLEDNLDDRFRTFKGIFNRLGHIAKYHNSSNQTNRKKAENYYESIFGGITIDLKKVNQHSHYLAKRIRDVVEPVTIRRNRLDLQKNPFYKEESKNLSKVADPKEWLYELTKEQSEFYDRIIGKYFADPEDGGQFKGAIYKPFEYEIKRKKITEGKLTRKENFQYFQQKNLYDFMRRLIVKRFESSFGSFKKSLENFKKITEDAEIFIKKTNKYILDRSLLEKIYNLDEEQIEEYLQDYSEKIKNGEYPKNHKIYNIDKLAYKKEFITHIKEDLQLFKNILKELTELKLVENDPKRDKLIKKIGGILQQKPLGNEPKRKILVFSEYIDTVKHLDKTLTPHFKNRMLVITGNLSKHTITEINKNFDASYNFDEQEDKYDILLASDKISEGFNLNRAGIVINYDIPWNPVRVIQRVGRINRISKKVFEQLYIRNFFPTEKGATIVKSREIVQSKMFLIHNTLGEDSKIFNIDEKPTPAKLYERIQQNPDEMEQEGFYTKALTLFLNIKKEYPEIIEGLKNCPSRIKVAKKSNEDELLVFLKKGRLYIYRLQPGVSKNTGMEQPTFDEVFDRIFCEKSEVPLSLSTTFWDTYEKIKTFKYRPSPLSDQSIEQKALFNIRSFITKPWDNLLPYMDFLRTLREDIIDYGTLPNYTLRRISNMEISNDKKREDTVNELKAIQQELGNNYLQKEMERNKILTKEIIIAIENQKQ